MGGRDYDARMADTESPPPVSSPQANIPMTAAVSSAKEFLLHLVKEQLVGGPIKGLALEGVRSAPDGGWLVILGYRLPTPFDDAGGIMAALRSPRSDIFKAFTIDGETGQVVSMMPYAPEGH